jgi:uncharacterized protein YwqG
MKEIRQLLEAKGLGRIADVVEAAQKPSVRFSPGESGEYTGTRLGGRPNLPLDIEWPRWQEQPLAFLAQVDLAALPTIKTFPVPRQGSLFFFHMTGEDGPWGYDPEDRGSACVKYSPHPLSNCELRALPDDLEEERQYRGISLVAQPVENTIPDHFDQVIDELGLKPDEMERYGEVVWEEWNSHWRSLRRPPSLPDLCHRMAGYPDRLQGDLRLEAQLVSHGLYCGDSSGYDEGKQRGLWPGAKQWQVLLQIDSEDAAGMMWGDSGRIYYLIHQSDLEEHRFDNVWVGMECM